MRALSRRQILVGTLGIGGFVITGQKLLQSRDSLPTFVNQISPLKIDGMPISQRTGTLIDWKQRAKAAYSLLFDFTAKGPNLPVIWNDTERLNYPFDMFALPAYLGDYRQNPGKIGSHESLSGIGAVLGATLSGLNMCNYQNRNYVHELLGYHQKNGVAKVLFNQTHENGSESSFWYIIYPNLSFYAVTSMYPDDLEYLAVMRQIADQFLEMLSHLHKITGELSFEFTGYNFLTKEGTYGSWQEPDSAAGIAWILYMAYSKFGDKKYLDGAKIAMDYLQKLTDEKNPFYEVLLGYGVIIAARMNVEAGTDYDVTKFLNWIFDGFSSVRAGWGIVSDLWGSVEVHGLQGSTTDSGGYAFAFNTYNMIAALAPLPIYAPQYRDAIAKWLYNTSVSARIFYPDQLPKENQSEPELIDQFGNGLAYEGVRKEWAFIYPYATADSRRMTWAATDIGIYGSGLIGILSGLIHSVESNGVVVFDISKTDFFSSAKTKTILAYNPMETAQIFRGVSIEPGKASMSTSQA